MGRPKDGDSTAFAVMFVLAVSTLAAPASAAACAGGDGSEGNPYKISEVQDLLDFSNAADSTGWDKHFRMTAGTQAETFSNPPGHICLVRVHGREAMLQ
jgi:hypothetical protein